jgi:thiol-disulfide isomerase/thioredoxin
MGDELENDAAVKEALSSKEPVVIFFYMIGCPYCDKMKGPWENLKAKHSDTKLVKVESQNVPKSLEGEINGFPHFMKIKDGKKVVSVGGSMSEQALEKELFGLRGGRSRRLRRRTRKVKRTLRRHV